MSALLTREELADLLACVQTVEVDLTHWSPAYLQVDGAEQVARARAAVERMIAESSREMAALLAPPDDGCYRCGAAPGTVATGRGDLCEDCWTMLQEEGRS